MEWYEAFKTLIALLENIVLHPKNKKYRKVQSTNGSFHRKLGRLPGGLDLLIAVGFREDSVGALVLDEGGTNDVNELVTFLRARLIELKAGLPRVMESAADENLTTRAARSKAKMSARTRAKNRVCGNLDPGKSDKAAGKRLKLKKRNAGSGSSGLTRAMEAQQKKHESMVKSLESEIRALRDKLDNTLPPRQADTIARMGKSSRSRAEKTAGKLGIDATSRRYATAPGSTIGAGSGRIAGSVVDAMLLKEEREETEAEITATLEQSISSGAVRVPMDEAEAKGFKAARR